MQHGLACTRLRPVAVQLDDLGIPAVILTRAEDGVLAVSHMNAAFCAVLAEASMDGGSRPPGPCPCPSRGA